MKEIKESETHTTSCINAIIRYVKTTHDINADGCKGSCNEIEIGYHSSTYYDSFWFCHFGGYCFGNLSRNETVQANSLEGLMQAVKIKIESALEQ
jgi:hypothetical protein